MMKTIRDDDVDGVSWPLVTEPFIVPNYNMTFHQRPILPTTLPSSSPAMILPSLSIAPPHTLIRPTIILPPIILPFLSSFIRGPALSSVGIPPSFRPSVRPSVRQDQSIRMYIVVD